MVVNLWQRVRLFCGNHEKDENGYPRMTPHEAASSATSRGLYGAGVQNMFYACPRYYPDAREEGEPACRNHISMKEFENMLDYISGIIEKANRADEICDLTGLSWKSKTGTEFKVIKHTDEHIDVVCLNKKSLWK